MEDDILKLKNLDFLVVEGMIRNKKFTSVAMFQFSKNPPIKVFLDTGNNKILKEELDSIEILDENDIRYTAPSKKSAIDYLIHEISLNHEVPLNQCLLERVKKIRY